MTTDRDHAKILLTFMLTISERHAEIRDWTEPELPWTTKAVDHRWQIVSAGGEHLGMLSGNVDGPAFVEWVNGLAEHVAESVSIEQALGRPMSKQDESKSKSPKSKRRRRVLPDPVVGESQEVALILSRLIVAIDSQDRENIRRALVGLLEVSVDDLTEAIVRTAPKIPAELLEHSVEFVKLLEKPQHKHPLIGINAGRLADTMSKQDTFDADGYRFDIKYEKAGWWAAVPSNIESWVAWHRARKFPGTIEQFMAVVPSRPFPLGLIRRRSLEQLHADILTIMGVTNDE